jgi:hypothetical protein
MHLRSPIRRLTGPGGEAILNARQDPVRLNEFLMLGHNNVIQKGLAFRCQTSVSVVVRLGLLLPRRLHRRGGAAVVTARCCASTPERPMSKLTDTQLITLSTASQRDDRGVVLPPNLRGGAVQKFVAKLLAAGLIEEIRARGDLPVGAGTTSGRWRCASPSVG